MGERQLKVGVIGLGTMGAGIAEVFARGGHSVVALDVTEEGVARGQGIVAKSLGKALGRGKITQEAHDGVLAAITYSTDLGSLSACDLVIEAVPEKLDLKTSLFTALDEIVSESAILATNTSSLSVTALASATKVPSRVIGMHFFNPAPILKLVEVITTPLTDEGHIRTVQELATSLGKEPVIVGDRAGFVGNYLLFGYLASAIAMLESGIATRSDIDAAMSLGQGFPMGPFALLDLIGLDISLDILETMYAQSGDPLHCPSPLLRNMVAAGTLGRKTSRGFYDYTQDSDDAPVRLSAPEVSRQAPIAWVVSDCAPEHVRASAAAWKNRLEAAGVTVLDGADTAAEAVLVWGDGALGEVCAKVGASATVMLVGASSSVTSATHGAAVGERVVGVHLPENTDKGNIAECVASLGVDGAHVEGAHSVLHELGLMPVTVTDVAGGIGDRLMVPYLCAAFRMVGENYATASDVDTAMTRGCGYPEGPIAAAQRQGLARVHALATTIAAETGQAGHATPVLLSNLVAAGATSL